ncbi:protein of unknown function [Georgenia satyanarayanai]|uniref:Uncharacterized protein n=1 Tax=Georgenia satyanarayanai TaxID=860221 RepID=A0A2Y9AHU6_9MICO|nr:uncharacterized protein DUF4333 [Georgenia satyanarayanai]SSA44031.1 protein of unknown function [Georgenia satyanarayanai]
MIGGAPVYLVQRRRLLGQSWATPLVWLASVLAYLASAGVVGMLGGVELDPATLEYEIEQGYREYGERAVVDCPDSAIAPVGGSVSCWATFSDGSVAEGVITVENAQGWFTWQESW